jgi:hypothetical protein
MFIIQGTGVEEAPFWRYAKQTLDQSTLLSDKLVCLSANQRGVSESESVDEAEVYL